MAIGVRYRELYVFFHHLKVQMNCHIPFVRAVEVYLPYCTSRGFRKFLRDVCQRLYAGYEIHSAFQSLSDDNTLMSLLRNIDATEDVRSGIQNILHYLEMRLFWKRNFLLPLIYPIFLLVLMIIIMIGMAYILLPQIGMMYGSELGGFSRMVLIYMPSDFWLLMRYIIYISVFLWMFLRLKCIRALFSHCFFRGVFIRGLMHQISLWQFASVMSVCLSANIMFEDALQLAHGVVTFSYFRERLKEVRMRILSGEHVHDAFAAMQDHALAGCMLGGQEHGNMKEIFDHLRDGSYESIQVSLPVFSRAIGASIIILASALLIATIVWMIMPLYEGMSAIKIY